MVHHSFIGLSTLTPRFDPRPVHVSVVVFGMALEEVVGVFFLFVWSNKVHFSCSMFSFGYFPGV